MHNSLLSLIHFIKKLLNLILFFNIPEYNTMQSKILI